MQRGQIEICDDDVGYGWSSSSSSGWNPRYRVVPDNTMFTTAAAAVLRADLISSGVVWHHARPLSTDATRSNLTTPGATRGSAEWADHGDGNWISFGGGMRSTECCSSVNVRHGTFKSSSFTFPFIISFARNRGSESYLYRGLILEKEVGDVSIIGVEPKKSKGSMLPFRPQKI